MYINMTNFLKFFIHRYYPVLPAKCQMPLWRNIQELPTPSRPVNPLKPQISGVYMIR